MIIDDELSGSRKRYGPEFKPIHENVSEHHEGLGYEGWTRFHEGPIGFVSAGFMQQIGAPSSPQGSK